MARFVASWPRRLLLAVELSSFTITPRGTSLQHVPRCKSPPSGRRVPAAVAADAPCWSNKRPNIAACSSRMVSAETSGAGAAGPLILLCGPSGVGKSSVAKELAAARHLALLSQDSYFGGDFVPYAEALERGRAEMEEPDQIDWNRVRVRP